MPSTVQYRSWCFTDNSVGTESPELHVLPSDNLERAIWQLERGEKEGRLHAQGLLQLKVKKTRAFVKTLLPGAHFESMHGSVAQAYAYCTKSKTHVAGPWTIGDWSDLRGQGKRSDLTRFLI